MQVSLGLPNVHPGHNGYGKEAGMMTRGRKKQPVETLPEPRRPAGAFKFPSRARSRQLESKAGDVAEAALERLHARTPDPEPELPEIQRRATVPPVLISDPEPMAEPVVVEPVAPEAVAEAPAPVEPKPTSRKPRPRPARKAPEPIGPFSIELDELADQLVDELRRDLGPNGAS